MFSRWLSALTSCTHALCNGRSSPPTSAPNKCLFPAPFRAHCDISKELRPDEIPLIRNARLLQFTAAGVDWVPTRDLPWELPVAANKGGGAEPMSEHIVALVQCLINRLTDLAWGRYPSRRLLRRGIDGWQGDCVGGWRETGTGTPHAGDNDRGAGPATGRDHPAAGRWHDARADLDPPWRVAGDGQRLVSALPGAASCRTG